MTKHIYTCTIQENLVLISKSKTEQNTEALAYIPGSNIRGIVAGSLFNAKRKAEMKKENNTEKINALTNDIDNIIFNGSVLFGDAHLIINGQRSYKIPASYYYEKDKDNNTIINFPTTDDFKRKKLKQQRTGYFVLENDQLHIAKPNYGDSIKSSRNIAKRSSLKNGLYVYHYLKKGQEFKFEILSENDNHLEKIKEILNGNTKFLGKAKGAEFGGKVLFKYSTKIEDVTIDKTSGRILYADSNLCFLNEFGEFTARPTAEQLTGNSNTKIDWEKSRLRFRRYMPYNQHRQNWDAERLIIEKGSVFVFENEVQFNENILKKGIGCFVTEGYGRVLINPAFLPENDAESKNGKEIAIFKEKEEYTTSNNSENNKPENKEYEETKNELLVSLIHHKEEENLSQQIQEKVNKYVKDNSFSKSITASQWNRVYNATKMSANVESLEKILEDIQKSKSKEIWKEKDKLLLKDFLNDKEVKKNKIFALKLLAKKMRFETKNKQEK